MGPQCAYSMVGPQCAYGHQICKNSLVRSFFSLLLQWKNPPLCPPQPPPSPSFSYMKSRTPPPWRMRGRPHLMGAVAQATRKSWERRQGLSTKGSSAGLSDVLSDVSSACGAPGRGHFSFIVSRDRFSGCANWHKIIMKKEWNHGTLTMAVPGIDLLPCIPCELRSKRSPSEFKKIVLDTQ